MSARKQNKTYFIPKRFIATLKEKGGWNDLSLASPFLRILSLLMDTLYWAHLSWHVFFFVILQYCACMSSVRL